LFGSSLRSKQNNSIETSSSFGSKFTAMKQGVEIAEGLRVQLRMMGVPLDDPTHIIKADNMSVIKNASSRLPSEWTNHISLLAREGSLRSCFYYLATRYEPTQSNLADMLMKAQPGPSTRTHLAHKQGSLLLAVYRNCYFM
jgi:hypothetical protein